MVRNSSASTTRPLRSNRARTSPIRPRRTASGLMSTSERSVELDTTDPPETSGCAPTRGSSAYRYRDSGTRQRRDYRTFASAGPGNNLTCNKREVHIGNADRPSHRASPQAGGGGHGHHRDLRDGPGTGHVQLG